jgi:hypothetical protein
MLQMTGFANLVQYFRESTGIARLIQKICRAKGKGGALIFRQVIVRQYDDLRPELRGCQRSHHAETGALPQMQVQNDHVYRYARDEGNRRGFCFRSSDQVNVRDLIDGFSQPFGQYFRVLNEQDSHGLSC